MFYVSLITLITLFGLYFRFDGLGKFPFSIDEYYFYSAVKITLDNGLPEFICGGFYTRGILLQYITAPFVYFIDNQELATRIPIVLFSVLSFPAIYLIGRDSHSRLAGVLALFLFAFSIWQVEFARFARMYAPFQMIFLWQVWLFLKPDLPNRSANILLNSLLASVATLFYAGGIFCVALAFFNVILYQKSFKITEYIPASIAASLAIIFTIIPFRHLGAEQPFPSTDYLQKTAPTLDQSAISKLPIDLPSFLTFSNHSSLILALIIIYAITAVLFLSIVFKNMHLSALTKTLISSTIFALLINQFLLALGLFTICLLTMKTWQDFYQSISNKIGVIFLTSTALWVTVCFVYFLLTNETNGIFNIAKTIFNNFFSYPDIFFDIFRQWQRPMPNHATLTVLSIITVTIVCIINLLSPKLQLRYFLTIFITMLFLVALINTPYDTSRYTFFLSSLASISIACCIVWSSSLLNNKIAKLAMILIGTSLTCYASEDYHYKHLFNIDSYTINHRQVYNKEFTEHLYPRYDYISVAEFLNANTKENDLIIITTPVIERYLLPSLRAEYFITSENPEFINHSVCHGKQETWSGLPLIYNYENLNNKLNNMNTNKWIVLHGMRGNPFFTQKLNTMRAKLKPYLAFENPDNTLRVYKINADTQIF